MRPSTRSLRSKLVCSLLFLTAAVAFAQPDAEAPFFFQDSLMRPSAADLSVAPHANGSLTSIRIPFVAADARDPHVSYYASTFAGTVFVTREGKIVYSLPAPKAEEKKAWMLTETLIGGKARPRGDGITPTRVSSFIGNDPSRWQTDRATYDAVALGEVWPGIDVSLRAYGHKTEKLFVVNPGAKASRIRMKVDGGKPLKVNGDGELVATTGLGDVTFSRPLAYQDIAGARHYVDVAYEVKGDRYRFLLGRYDATRPVVIDPLLQSTYLGGSVGDSAEAMVIHPTTGEVFIAGTTSSTDFPGTTGGARPASHWPGTSFVARLDATLTVLLQATYLGPDDGSFTGAFALAVSPTTDEVYVAGETSSDSFPGTVGGAQPFQGSNDAFVTRLNSSLTELKQSTYLGGSVVDGAWALVIDPTTKDVIVAGNTDSPDFLGTAGGAQPAYGGNIHPREGRAIDGFVARLNAGLTTLRQATYLGGGADEIVHAVTLYPPGNEVIVGGETYSDDFPGTADGAQPERSSESHDVPDGFIARLDSGLTSFLRSTYLGGSERDAVLALAVSTGSAELLASGRTSSVNFPGTAGGAQPSNHGELDGFIARLNPDLSTLKQATYVGGTGSEDWEGLAVDPATGDVFVGGLSSSNDLPGRLGGAQPTYAGNTDVFVVRLNSLLSTLRQATYLGGRDLDLYRSTAAPIALHPITGEVVIAGTTCSRDFPGTAGGAQESKHGGCDAFAARLTSDLQFGSFALLNPYVSFSPVESSLNSQPSTASCAGGKFFFQAMLTNTSDLPISSIVVKVTTLTNGNLLENADGGPGGVGATLTVPARGVYGDQVLAPGESVAVRFVICLTKKSGFDFFVDVFGQKK
jgi:hypothetical protein